MKKVAILVGSARKGSVNRLLAENIARLAADKLECTFVQIDDLPLYNNDLWEDTPAAVVRFKAEIEAADALLIVTPEYNRFFSPLIKNAIDWGSKPMGSNVFTGMPAAAMGATPGQLGAMAAVLSTVQLLNVVGCAVMATPSVYFIHRKDHHDEDGVLTNGDSQAFLGGWVEKFEAWIDRFV